MGAGGTYYYGSCRCCYNGRATVIFLVDRLLLCTFITYIMSLIFLIGVSLQFMTHLNVSEITNGLNVLGEQWLLNIDPSVY